MKRKAESGRQKVESRKWKAESRVMSVKRFALF